MSEREQPIDQPDEHEPRNDASQDIQLSQQEREAFEQFLTEIESASDPVVEILTSMSTNRDDIVKALVDISSLDVFNDEKLIESDKQINTPSAQYFGLLQKLPTALETSDTPQNEAIDTLLQQYRLLDESVVTCIVDITGDDTFRPARYDEVRQLISDLYNADGIEVEQVGLVITEHLHKGVSSDIGRYVDQLMSKAKSKANRSFDQKIDTIIGNTQSIIEELNDVQSPPLSRRIGKHALDIAKIAAGSTLGYVIAKKFTN